MNFQESNISRHLKIFALTAFFLIKCNFLFAQKDLTDPAKAYDYWSKRGIIEVVYAYMNDYINTVTDSTLPKEKIKDCAKEKQGLIAYENQFVTPLDNLRIEELSLKLNDVSSFMKSNNWTSAEKNLLQPLLINLNKRGDLTSSFFNTQKPSDNEKSTYISGYFNKLSYWNRTVEKIVSEYNKVLKKVEPAKDSEGITEVDPIKYKTIQPQPISPGSVPLGDNWLVIIFIGLLSFLMGGFLVFYYIKARIFSFLDDDDVETYQNSTSHKGLSSFLSIVHLLKKRKDEYKNKVAELNKEILQIGKTIHQDNNTTVKSNSDLVEIENQQVKTENTAKTVEWDISKESADKISLYFSIPENDGRFIIEKGEKTNDGDKYYKIEFRNNSDEGDLFYISGTQDKRAINRLDSYLKPVCDIDNIINAGDAVKIELLMPPGKVSKHVDSWVIDPNNKVKIKLV